MELNSKNMEKSMLKIKQELNSLKLKQLRCTHAAWYYA